MMLKKTTSYLWSLRQQFIKYFVIGIGAVILDMASLLFLKEILGLTPFIAVTLNQLIVLVYVFVLNKYWSFKGTVFSHRQIFRFGAVVGFDYVFAVFAMYIFNTLLNFNYILVRLTSIALAVCWNFFLYKYWVYAKAAEPAIIAADKPAGNNE